jgi:hypothetical protein
VTTSLDDAERRALRQKARTAMLDALRALGGDARREAILERALADGGFTPRELAAPPPEAAGEKYARLVDHDLSWALARCSRGFCRVRSAAQIPARAEHLRLRNRVGVHAVSSVDAAGGLAGRV